MPPFVAVGGGVASVGARRAQSAASPPLSAYQRPARPSALSGDGYRRMRRSLVDEEGEGHFEGPPSPNDELRDDAFMDENEEHQVWEPDVVKRLTKSHGFQATVGVVIGLNTIVMWLELDYPWEGWDYFENSILLFFTAEVALRLYTFGPAVDPHRSSRGAEDRSCFYTFVPTFFYNKDRWWNVFDLAVVTFGVCDLWVIQPLSEGKHSELSRFVTILRVVRMFRLLRLIRLFRFLHELYVLATAVVEAVSVVGWITLMFLLIIMVFSIVCTTAVGKEWIDWSDEEDQEFIKEKFGTVTRSAFTLFQFVTLDDWSSCTALVGKVKPAMYGVFYLYIMVTAFTILSLLTGVISDRIMKLTAEQDDLIEKSHEESCREFCDEVRTLFRQSRHGRVKLDKRKVVTREDFKKFVYELRPVEGLEGTQSLESIGSRLKNLEVEVDEDDCGEVFDVLDVHHRGYVNQDEFVTGLQRMRGTAQAKDIVRLQGAVHRLDRQIQRTHFPAGGGGDFLNSPKVRQFKSALDKISQTMQDLEGKVHGLEDNYSKFMRFHGAADMLEETRSSARSAAKGAGRRAAGSLARP